MAGQSGVRLDWGGLDTVLEGAAHAFDKNNRKTLLSNVGEVLVSSTVQRFQDGKDHEGKSWEPSARAWEAGLARKARKATEKRKGRKGRKETGNFGKTLVDTARLRNSVDHAVTDSDVMVGSNLEYARIHQKGGKAGRNHAAQIPKRAYLGISEDDKEEIAKIIGDYLKNGFTGG